MSDNLHQIFTRHFEYHATNDQLTFFEQFYLFTFKKNYDIFILKGYAGTGKTSVISHVAKCLNYIKAKFTLLAPTGRAAKVLSNYSSFTASTIHKKIYFVDTQSHNTSFKLKENKHTNTIFFVDESSMLDDNTTESSWSDKRSLLEDLINYVFQGKNCQLVFIGDTAQLPPIKSTQSPALDLHYLQSKFGKSVTEVSLTDVVRQNIDSGILTNATTLRKQINRYKEEHFCIKLTDDVNLPEDGYELEESLRQSYYNYSVEDTLIIVRSNKRANLYNQQIRQRLMGFEKDLTAGDYIMIVKNNYFWLDPNSEANFLANGDMAEVLEVRNYIELYGFKFADVTLRLIDYPNLDPIETKVILNSLDIDQANLAYEDLKSLYQEIAKDYGHLNGHSLIRQKIKKNPYYNALQIKYAYAMTCHKAQGGQWCNVFIEKPYLKEGQNQDYLRWLYTAITRAQKHICLIGFNEKDVALNEI